MIIESIIKTVTTEEFDKSVLKVGQLITFCNVYVHGDTGEKQLVSKTNGIITYVDDTAFTVVTANNDRVRISIEQLKNDGKRILGILDDAIAPKIEEPIIPDEEPKEEDGEGSEDDTDVIE